MNAEALALAPVEHRIGVAVGDAVAVLDRDHGDDLAGALELADVDVRKPDAGDLPLLAQLGERSHRLLQRHLGSTAWSW